MCEYKTSTSFAITTFENICKTELKLVKLKKELSKAIKYVPDSDMEDYIYKTATIANEFAEKEARVE
jgi:hypothetical protein